MAFNQGKLNETSSPIGSNKEDYENNYEWTDSEDDEELAKLDYLTSDGCQCSQDTCQCSAYSLECDKIFRGKQQSSHQYLQKYHTVTDFAKQHWCEQQLLYNLDPDIYLSRVPPGTEVNLEESKEVTEIKEKGSGIHLTRELEISTPVEVDIETVEDNWAVRVLNLWTAVINFLSGSRIAREVPVFGEPFGQGAFVFGIIDELKYDPVSHTVTISDLKTRKSKFPPKLSQQRKDKYQVSLYAHLFNELVQGKVTKEMVGKHLKLDLDLQLGQGVMEHINSTFGSDEMSTLSKLLDKLISQIQCLTCITSASVEYLHQETETQILVSQFDLDPDEFRVQFLDQLSWWAGNRGTKGVDIEDCWKCNFCAFQDWCEWRDVRAQQMRKDIMAV